MTKSLFAEFTVKPGHEKRVAEMMLALTDAVRREPGNILFNAYTRDANPSAYFVFEIYQDETAFAEHINADYGARFNAELSEHIEEDGSVLTFLNPLDE